MAEKKVFVSIKNSEAKNPIRMTLEKVSSLTQQAVDNPEDADLIVVDSSSNALTMLKENDEAIIIVAVMPGMEHEEIGARSLKKAYPGRVVVGQIFWVEDGTDDVLIIPYIMGFTSGKKGGRIA